MSDLTIGLLGALLATNQLLAAGNPVQQNTGGPVAIVNTNDPAEQELEKLMEADDAALDEVDRWIQTNNVLAATGAGESKEALNQRIRDTVRSGPDKLRGFLAASSEFGARLSGLRHVSPGHRRRGGGQGST